MSKIRKLPDDLQKIAIEELDENPDRVPDDIAALKNWIEQQPHLRARTDDQFLLGFLRGCKFSLEKAKKKIDSFYTLKSRYPDFYTTNNMKETRVIEIIKMGVGLHLPTPLHGNGPRMYLIRPGCYSPDKCSIDEIMCVAHTMDAIALMEDDNAVVNGFIDILDMSNLTPGHMLQMTPTVIKKMSTFVEEALPLRQKATIFINTNSKFLTFFNMLKTFMPQKQQDRLHVYGSDFEKLFEQIPKKYLPKDYGGENETIDNLIKQSLLKYEEYRDFFLEEKQFGTDEKLRPGKSVDYDSIFGVDGSFRKINVD